MCKIERLPFDEFPLRVRRSIESRLGRRLFASFVLDPRNLRIVEKNLWKRARSNTVTVVVVDIVVVVVVGDGSRLLPEAEQLPRV